MGPAEWLESQGPDEYSTDYTPLPSQQWQALCKLDQHHHSVGKTKELRSLGHTGAPVSSEKCSAHQYFPLGGAQPISCILHTIYIPPIPPESGRQTS